jgi:hypothetical protein
MGMLLLLACTDSEKADDSIPSHSEDSTTNLVDTDGDGVPDIADCDPNDPYTYPGANELPYDGKDQDCDGEDITDYDGDGYVGVNGGGDDCDDNNPTINPGATEICYNGFDDDCSGEEEDINDCDGDGYIRGSDCDDEDASINPGITETWYDGIDSDCGQDDDYDQDHDGEQSSDYGGSDCMDTDPLVMAEAPERWDGVENNCDAAIDTLNAEEATTFYHGDGFIFEDNFGDHFLPLGDIDGDGRRDVAVGIPDTNERAGRLYVLPIEPGIVYQETSYLATMEGTEGLSLGLSLASLKGPTSYLAVSLVGGTYLFDYATLTGHVVLEAGTFGIAQAAGYHAASWPDLDGDGTEDLLLATGARSSEAAIHSSSSSFNSAFWTGSADRGNTVENAASAGDLSGDGLDELVVLATIDGNQGLYLVDGALVEAGGTTLLSEQPFLTAPSEPVFGVLNDISGDGIGELALSFPESGEAYLVGSTAFNGGLVASGAFASITGDSGLYIGLGQLDMDGDSSLDILVGMPGDGNSGTVGSCQWLSGPVVGAGGNHRPTPGIPYFVGMEADDQFCSSLRAADEDGDGDSDLWVGSRVEAGSLLLFTQE